MDKSSLSVLFILAAASLLACAALQAKQHAAAPAKAGAGMSWAGLGGGESTDAAGEPGYFVGNRASGIYHRAGCRYVGRMLPGNEVIFETRDKAEAAGYRACEICLGG